MGSNQSGTVLEKLTAIYNRTRIKSEDMILSVETVTTSGAYVCLQRQDIVSRWDGQIK